MRDEAPDKATWIVRLERARTSWEDLVHATGDAFDEPGVMGDWAFRDVASHLNGWREWTTRRMEAAAGDQGAPVVPWPAALSESSEDDVDRINQWFHEQGRTGSYDDVLAASRRQFQCIRQALDALTDADLQRPVSWLDGQPLRDVLDGMIEHWRVDHEPDIAQWLASRER